MIIHFGDDKGHFLYRVAAVCIREGRVLVVRWEDDASALHCLPGGRVEIGESAEEALAREIREELDCNVTPGRLLWVMENFFNHKDSAHHELGM